MANPVFSREPSFQQGTTLNGQPSQRTSQTPTIGAPGLEQQFNSPSADPMAMGRMTYQGSIVKTFALFIVAVVAAVVAAQAIATVPDDRLLITYYGTLGASFVLSLIIGFSRTTNPTLLVPGIALWGGFAGMASFFYEVQFGGIVAQALIATASVFAACLFAFTSGKFRTTAKSRKIVTVIMSGYVVFAVVNFGMGLISGGNMRDASLPGTDIPFGVPIGILAVALAAFFIIRDFEFIENGVERGAPAKFEWLGAYGLVFTLVWLYLEILRLLSYLRGR